MNSSGQLNIFGNFRRPSKFSEVKEKNLGVYKDGSQNCEGLETAMD
jgi:hypothetical protein